MKSEANHQDVAMRSLEELTTGKRRIVDAIYFDGLEIFRCYDGRFRFSFKDRSDIVLEQGEVLIIYPRHKVTIDALARKNRLVYGVFEGRDVEDYFDSFGFYDFAKGHTEAHFESLQALKRAFEAGEYLLCLADILRTQAEEIRKAAMFCFMMRFVMFMRI